LNSQIEDLRNGSYLDVLVKFAEEVSKQKYNRFSFYREITTPVNIKFQTKYSKVLQEGRRRCKANGLKNPFILISEIETAEVSETSERAITTEEAITMERAVRAITVERTESDNDGESGDVGASESDDGGESRDVGESDNGGESGDVEEIREGGEGVTYNDEGDEAGKLVAQDGRCWSE
jgi:hypothetical protein